MAFSFTKNPTNENDSLRNIEITEDRLVELANYVNTNFPVAIPNPNTGAQYQVMLVNSTTDGYDYNHILRSNVALQHTDGNGTSGQVLQSDGDGTTSWLTFSGLTDGDKGDITVSGTGSTFTIDNDAVTFAKMQNLSGDKVIGNDTGSGDPKEIDVDHHMEILSDTLALKTIRAHYVSYSESTATIKNRVQNTTTETSIIQGFNNAFPDPDWGTNWPSIGANTLNGIDTFRYRASGKITTTGTPTMRARLKLGSVTICDSTAITSPVSGISGLVEIEGTFTFRDTGGSGRAVGNIWIKITDESTRQVYCLSSAQDVLATGIDTTSALNFGATFQWGTASSSNDLHLTNTVVERVL